MVRIQDNTVRDGMQQRDVNKNFRTKLQVFGKRQVLGWLVIRCQLLHNDR